MSDLDFITIAEASRRIRSLALSPVELTQHYLDRIEALDSRCNAFLEVTSARALADAEHAAQEIRGGRYRGPMHGIPYAVKDLFDVAGLKTTCHSKILADNQRSDDAWVVSRLREAGAVLVGKLALHEFGTGGPTFDLPWPPARNPWNLDLHPGGSSSGAAAALAAGMVPAALGSDTGGSVRNPATCCGVVGLKPTYGAVSRRGAFPLSFSLDHIGPMTRTVEDNAILYQTIAGYDPQDPSSSRRPIGDCLSGLQGGIKGLRIGVIEHFYTDDAKADDAMLASIEQAIEVLRQLGAEVSRVRLSPLSVWSTCGRTIIQCESYAVHERWLRERPEDYCEISRRKLMMGAFVPASDYIKALQLRTMLSAEFERAMVGLDAMVTLSGLDLPCRLDRPDDIARTYERHVRMPFNITGTPALAVPAGFSEHGVPVGFQIAGKAFDEAMVYRIAWAYCESTGWTEQRPAFATQEKPAAVSEVD